MRRFVPKLLVNNHSSKEVLTKSNVLCYWSLMFKFKFSIKPKGSIVHKFRREVWLVRVTCNINYCWLILHRVTFLKIIWLECNKICFRGIFTNSLKAVGSNKIALSSFWCKIINDVSFFKLTLILPCDVIMLRTYQIRYRLVR